LTRPEELELSLTDYVEILYPKATSGKQHDIALKLLTELFDKTELSNREARRLVDSASGRVLLMGNVLPKMRKLGLIETDNQDTPKKYKIRVGRDFSDIFDNLAMDWVIQPRKIRKKKQTTTQDRN